MNQNMQPKKWKFALLIWSFIYPAISLLSLTLFPLLADFPSAIKSLITSLILVPVMVWLYIPFVNKRFAIWLRK